MKCTILFASPRGEQSNTLFLTRAFQSEWTAMGHTADFFSLYDLSIAPCRACRGCQQDWEHPACVIRDDMDAIFESILSSDWIVLASPIYSWYCTAPLKASLDRCVYALNKFYGESVGPALWKGKRVAILTTCGYRPEKGADLFEQGVRRLCKHSGLIYSGMLAERHTSYKIPFPSPDKAQRARDFALEILAK